MQRIANMKAEAYSPTCLILLFLVSTSVGTRGYSFSFFKVSFIAHVHLGWTRRLRGTGISANNPENTGIINETQQSRDGGGRAFPRPAPTRSTNTTTCRTGYCRYRDDPGVKWLKYNGRNQAPLRRNEIHTSGTTRQRTREEQ